MYWKRGDRNIEQRENRLGGNTSLGNLHAIIPSAYPKILGSFYPFILIYFLCIQ